MLKEPKTPGCLHGRFQYRAKTQQRVTRHNKDLHCLGIGWPLAKRRSPTVGQNFTTV